MAATRIVLPVLLASLAAGLEAQGDLLYTVSTSSNLLRTVDPLTAITIGSVPIVSSTSVPAASCNGMSRDPISGQLYVLVRLTTGSTRYLATLAPATGIATLIGPMADNYAGIAFRVDGTLFGVTGDGATVPESLYTISLMTATATFVRAFGSGNNGETIGFGADLAMYHASGAGAPNVDEVFQHYDTFTDTLTDVPLSGHDYNELLAVTSWVGGNLLGADNSSGLLAITTAGFVTRIGTLDHLGVKGIAFVPSPSTQPFFRVFGDGCAATGGAIPLLAGAGVPTPGTSVQLQLLLAPASSLGVIGLGLGAGALPFPSPACQLQINPLAFTLPTFVIAPTGDFSVNVPLPAGLQPIDVFLQAGVLDGASLVVSNPLQMHLQ